MDEKVKDHDVLLVKEPSNEKIKVVAGVDGGGKLKTVPPSQTNQQDFMKIDKHSNVLENFFTNFMRQIKDPTHFKFFKGSSDNIESNANTIDGMLQNPTLPQNKEALDSLRVNPADHAKQQSQGYQSIDPSRIDWAQFERIGVPRKHIEHSGSFDAMLNFRKSPILIPIILKIDDMEIRTDARLSLKELPDGRVIPNIHAIQKEPPLDRPFYGHTFTDEEKKSLLAIGNLGKLIDLKIPGKEDVRAFVSIDKLTKDVVALDARKVRVPDEIKGVQLSEQQTINLAEGKGIYVKGMTAANGQTFNATLQFNVDKRGIEFKFDNSPKETTKQQQQQTQSEQAAKVLRVPNKLLGRDVSPEEQAKLKAGTVIYMEGLKDRKGEPFNAYVKPDFKEGCFRFITPEKYEKQQVTPDSTSQTQVAVNSEGKTNEATKNVNEPLKQGQVEATPQQKQESEQHKPKGVRM